MAQVAGSGIADMAPNSPLCLAVDAVREVKGVGIAVAAANAKAEGPEAARRVADAGVNRDGAEECPSHGVEGADTGVDKAKIADQQVASELTETGRCKSNAPRRGEVASCRLEPAARPRSH